MKHHLLTTLLLFITLSLSAQFETAHWVFGINAGLDFNSGEPECVDGYPLVANHGSATMSDPSGNLLLYTDGFLVWNRIHEVMPNGILGDSCTGTYTKQNCFLIPRVGYNHQFYLFTISKYFHENKGLKYHIIDMSKDGGLGDVVEQSIHLQDSLFNGAAITQHANGIDYWFVIRTLKDNERQWEIFLVDESGPHFVNSYDAVPGHDDSPMTGKFSPNGKMLNWSHYVFDFDKSTGEITGYRYLWSPGQLQSYAMAEFSPDSKVLYASYPGSTAWYINQFDLTADTIANTRIPLEELMGEDRHIKGGMQLGLDGKIYISFMNEIGVINNPNQLGIGCDYQQKSMECPGRARWGFPMFSSHYFKQETTSILDKEEVDILIYPNPTDQYFTIMDKGNLFRKYELLSIEMKRIETGSLRDGVSRIDASYLNAGVYFVRLFGKGANVVKKVVVK